MSTTPTDASAATARFVMLRDLPLLVVDLEPPPEVDTTDPMLQGGLFAALAERGMVVLPRFYEVDLPRGVRVGLTLDPSVARLEDDQETTLLRVDRGPIDPTWVSRAVELRGTMLCVGPGLGIGPDHTPHEVCDLLDIAATAGRVVGAIVGVAEPQQGLPLIF